MGITTKIRHVIRIEGILKLQKNIIYKNQIVVWKLISRNKFWCSNRWAEPTHVLFMDFSLLFLTLLKYKFKVSNFFNNFLKFSIFFNFNLHTQNLTKERRVGGEKSYFFNVSTYSVRQYLITFYIFLYGLLNLPVTLGILITS